MKRLVVLAALLALPLPAAAQTNNALIEQGRTLFNDPRLSASGQVSCMWDFHKKDTLCDADKRDIVAFLRTL